MLRFSKAIARNLKLMNSLLEDTKDVRQFCINRSIIKVASLKTFCTSSASPVTEDSNNEPNFAEITGGDPELEHKLKVLILELDVGRQEGLLVPSSSSLKTNHWKELLRLPSLTARRKYLLFLFKMEKKHENQVKKKEQKRLEREQNPPPLKEDNALNYNLGYNNMFLRVYDSTINDMNNNRLIQAMNFGEKLIVDCGYHEYMVNRENQNCAKQIMLLFAENRASDDPYDLHLYNCNRESTLMKTLHRFIPTMYDPEFPLNVHEKSYLDAFPKEQLVYLTPHCREVLHQYDHDSVYIIGAIVDKVNQDPLSLAKAKKEGIRMAKLPLDNYLEWGSGSGKSLTINQVLSILIDAKRTGDWKYALRHVPKRKLVDFTQDMALRKFSQAIGYTANMDSRKINPQKKWRPKPQENTSSINIDLKDILENK